MKHISSCLSSSCFFIHILPWQTNKTTGILLLLIIVFVSTSFFSVKSKILLHSIYTIGDVLKYVFTNLLGISWRKTRKFIKRCSSQLNFFCREKWGIIYWPTKKIEREKLLQMTKFRACLHALCGVRSYQVADEMWWLHRIGTWNGKKAIWFQFLFSFDSSAKSVMIEYKMLSLVRKYLKYIMCLCCDSSCASNQMWYWEGEVLLGWKEVWVQHLKQMWHQYKYYVAFVGTSTIFQ